MTADDVVYMLNWASNPDSRLVFAATWAWIRKVEKLGPYKIRITTKAPSAIDLQNVTTEHTRAESITNRKFDAVVSRAVAPLKELWQWSKPLLKRPSHPVSKGEACGLICLKGGDLTSEIAESNCRPRITEIHSLFPEAYFEEKFVLQVM